MNLANNIAMNLYSIILLAIICIYSLRNADMESLQPKLYMMMLLTTIFMLVFDTFGRFDGSPGTIYPVLNSVGNFVIFIFKLN